VKIYFEMEEAALEMANSIRIFEPIDEAFMLEQRWRPFPVGRSMINGLSPPCWEGSAVRMLFSPEWTEAERSFWNTYRSGGDVKMELEVSDDFFDNLRLY